jgi:6-phosphogluconolactonase/glucosamine-6-phosphate isomerase/deaminase
MREKVLKLISSLHSFSHEIDNISVCPVSDSKQGLQLAKEILYGTVDLKTSLYLSGGNTPKLLYTALAQEEKIKPGVVGLIDERYEEQLHDRSNEKMIIETGLVRYLSMRDIPYYPILHSTTIEKTAQRYDELYRSLGTVYQKSIGILGIGEDGHTAGIAPSRSDFPNPLFNKNNYDMVGWFDDKNGYFKKRVTMTFLGLGMLDLLIVLVFGKEKKRALEDMLSPSSDGGKEEVIPARFYKRPDIAPKTLLITDQTV